MFGADIRVSHRCGSQFIRFSMGHGRFRRIRGHKPTASQFQGTYCIMGVKAQIAALGGAGEA